MNRFNFIENLMEEYKKELAKQKSYQDNMTAAVLDSRGFTDNQVGDPRNKERLRRYRLAIQYQMIAIEQEWKW